MFKMLDDFRARLDRVMCKCINKRIILYGYGYSGKFIGWYAEYYHNIKPDYIVTMDWSSNVPYEFELFRESVITFNYKDVQDAVVWLCIPETDEICSMLTRGGYIKNQNYFNFCEIAYEGTGITGNDVNIQFLRWLEEIYLCDFVGMIKTEDFLQKMDGTSPYVCMTQKEIFPILDKCHISHDDAIFDFGCGKGGAMLSFLDYGIKNVGGIEFQDNIYHAMVENFKKLQLERKMQAGEITCLRGDASKLGDELDAYSWFSFFDPFRGEVFEKTIERIVDSLNRNPRKAYIIYMNPYCHNVIENSGKFLLTNSFTIMTRQRVVNVYVTK